MVSNTISFIHRSSTELMNTPMIANTQAITKDIEKGSLPNQTSNAIDITRAK
jgi:hypothetical protein